MISFKSPKKHMLIFSIRGAIGNMQFETVWLPLI